LAYDEAWIGEHHSAGWEYIASPELFIAFAAERTRHIKLGTGVLSLPYHQLALERDLGLLTWLDELGPKRFGAFRQQIADALELVGVAEQRPLDGQPPFADPT
jgi:limonene 1,2-monooxygenase